MEKVERLFKNGIAREDWKGAKAFVGLLKRQTSHFPSEQTPAEFAEDLNNFYCQFDQRDFCLERSTLNTGLLDQSVFVSNISMQIEDVERVFKGIKSNKTLGPDKISGCQLKTCFRELQMFNVNPHLILWVLSFLTDRGGNEILWVEQICQNYLNRKSSRVSGFSFCFY